MAKSFFEKVEKKRATTESPAMMFITQPEELTPPAAETRTPSASPLQAERPMRAPQGREAKTRRLQLLLTPSLYESVKERAEAEGLSVNETISELLQRALSI